MTFDVGTKVIVVHEMNGDGNFKTYRLIKGAIGRLHFSTSGDFCYIDWEDPEIEKKLGQAKWPWAAFEIYDEMKHGSAATNSKIDYLQAAREIIGR